MIVAGFGWLFWLTFLAGFWLAGFCDQNRSTYLEFSAVIAVISLIALIGSLELYIH